MSLKVEDETSGEVGVSALITTYNQAEYLREAIESVFAQTYQPLEVIVVDNGSTDHTAHICASFGGRIRYFYHDRHGSMLGAAHIRGIKETSGELIAFLDHDDRWLPTKLEKQVRMLEANPEVGAVFTIAQPIDSSGRPADEPFRQVPSGEVFHLLLESCSYTHSSALVRRAALERGGLHDCGVIAGDWDQWLRIARYYPLLVINECLTERRMHDGNVTKNSEWLFAAKKTVLRRQVDRLHPNCSECTRALRRGTTNVAASQNLDRCGAMLLDGQFLGALPYLLQAMRISPRSVLTRRRSPALKKAVLAELARWKSRLSSGPLH